MPKELSRRHRYPHRATGNIRLILWVFAAFVLGYAAASYYDMAHVIRFIQTVQMHSKVINKALPIALNTQTLEPPKPNFEFYTLLTKAKHGYKREQAPVSMASAQQAAKHELAEAPQAHEPRQPPLPAATVLGSVSVAANEHQPAAARAEEIPSHAAKKESYLIQVAAFSRRDDAEKLKASLLLKGYDVSIVAYKQPNAYWFRVIIGPYGSRTEAERIHGTMARRDHIYGMIRKMA